GRAFRQAGGGGEGAGARGAGYALGLTRERACIIKPAPSSFTCATIARRRCSRITSPILTAKTRLTIVPAGRPRALISRNTPIAERFLARHRWNRPPGTDK